MDVPDKFEEFYLLRIEDETGISGTGVVARGVVFPSGKAVMEWCTFHSSVGLYNNIQDVDKIHGHQGKTRVIMGSPSTKIIAKKRKKRKKSD